jgi:hypothetical protein
MGLVKLKASATFLAGAWRRLRRWFPIVEPPLNRSDFFNVSLAAILGNLYSKQHLKVVWQFVRQTKISIKAREFGMICDAVHERLGGATVVGCN